MHYVCHAFREAGKGLTISSVLTPPFDYDKLDRINAYFENFPELPKETSIVITYPSDGTYDCEAYTKRVYNNPRYWDLGSYDPLAKWQLTQAIRHSLSWDSTNNLYFRALVDSMMRIKNRFASENRLCELAGLRRAVFRACAKFMCTQMEDCLFASELEPLPPLARLRRASTRTKPFILILMTIWPKPNHYVRTCLLYTSPSPRDRG